MRDLLINVRNAVTRSSAIMELPRPAYGIRLSLLPNRTTRYRDVIRRVGCTRSSDEVAVMAMEPRGAVIQC